MNNSSVTAKELSDAVDFGVERVHKLIFLLLQCAVYEIMTIRHNAYYSISILEMHMA
jgi:hypothetical protein